MFMLNLVFIFYYNNNYKDAMINDAQVPGPGPPPRAPGRRDRRGHEWASQAMAQEVGPLDVFSLPF